MSYSKIKSYAKINLALNIIGKVSTLHKIESIISFLDLHDEISIKNIENKNHKIKFIGEFSKNINSNNSVFRLLKILDKKRLLKKKKFEIIIIRLELIEVSVIWRPAICNYTLPLHF